MRTRLHTPNETDADVSFLVVRLQFVIGRLQNMLSGIIERQGNPALTNALTGVGLGVATAGASFLGKN